MHETRAFLESMNIVNQATANLVIRLSLSMMGSTAFDDWPEGHAKA